jgi:hypothetical protein
MRSNQDWELEVELRVKVGCVIPYNAPHGLRRLVRFAGAETYPTQAKKRSNWEMKKPIDPQGSIGFEIIM